MENGTRFTGQRAADREPPRKKPYSRPHLLAWGTVLQMTAIVGMSTETDICHTGSVNPPGLMCPED